MSDVTITEREDGGLSLERQSREYAFLHADVAAALREHFAAERRMPEDVKALVGHAKSRVDANWNLSHGQVGEPSDGALVLRLAAALDAVYGTGGE